VARALQVSLPIAVAVCLMIAAAFMRSIRLALIVIVPILVVVAWLYAFMFVFGFAINLVTATIGALSIGIGIDFAIHFTERWREEHAALGDATAAVRAAAEGTGLALVGSAASSIVGFAIMAFAPMPLFASYGLLTAVMIAMALFASLAVLPSLLVLAAASDASTSDADHTPAASTDVPAPAQAFGLKPHAQVDNARVAEAAAAPRDRRSATFAAWLSPRLASSPRSL